MNMPEKELICWKTGYLNMVISLMHIPSTGAINQIHESTLKEEVLEDSAKK
jgi:hypothetical protein